MGQQEVHWRTPRQPSHQWLSCLTSSPWASNWWTGLLPVIPPTSSLPSLSSFLFPPSVKREIAAALLFQRTFKVVPWFQTLSSTSDWVSRGEIVNTRHTAFAMAGDNLSQDTRNPHLLPVTSTSRHWGVETVTKRIGHCRQQYIY